MSYKTILLTGIPRSGSTLACNLLNSYENTVALLEPINISNFKPLEGRIQACKNISNFVFDSRNKIINDRVANTKHFNGIVPSNPLEEKKSATELRNVIVKDGIINIDKKISKNFTLVIKHNALFTSLLPELSIFFECYGIIRNPLSVLASWLTVNLPINQGHIPAGEQYDKHLKKKLANLPNIIDRQLVILDWFFQKFYETFDTKHIIRYENVIENSANVFDSLSYDKQIIDKNDNRLMNKNYNKEYKGTNLEFIYNKLINSQGVYWKFYSKSEIRETYQRLKETK